MAQLAIKGHATRGEEVIEILEMLGGENIYKLDGKKDLWYILSGSTIEHATYCFQERGYTLEEFLEKFPYKVKDTVLYKHDDKTFFIRNMVWKYDKILYDLSDEMFSGGCSVPDTLIFDVDVVKLQPYKEETMEELIIDTIKESADRYRIKVNYQFDIEVDEGEYYAVRRKLQYPKTYKECCDVLGLSTMDNDAKGYKDILIIQFQELLIARDAYWKIAGEQMGLGEPWKPDWLNVEQDKFVLYTHDNVICFNRFVLGHNVLAFPTAEMREAFLENYKKLIEHVKELL